MEKEKIDKIINNRVCYYDRHQCKSLDDLLLRLGIEPLSDSAHEILLIDQAQKGNLEALEYALRCNMISCVTLSNQYQHKGLSLLELIKLAERGMVRAILTYEPDGETKFISYSIQLMRREITDALAQVASVLRAIC